MIARRGNAAREDASVGAKKTFVDELFGREELMDAIAGAEVVLDAGGPLIIMEGVSPPARQRLTRRVVSESGVTHVYYDAGPCQWGGCETGATHLVGQVDTETQDEDPASFRYMCHTHALQVQQMAEEAE